MIAISSLLLVVVISLVVTRVATVLLTATGLSRHAARFQARSALTGSGFTTKESESVVTHPLRRRVIMTLMLLGNAGIVAAASSLIIGFRSGSLGQQWTRVVELVAGLAVLVLLSRSPRIDRWLTRKIRHLLHRFTDLPERDIGSLLELSGGYSIKELAVTSSDWIAERSLAESGLRDEGIVVLGLTRANGEYLGAPTASTPVNAGDVLIIYGRAESLADLDGRPRGQRGDQQHAAGVAQQRQLEGIEGRRDSGIIG